MLYTTKDLAAEMILHPCTVKRWWKRLRVPPDACARSGCHRWTARAKARLLKRWRKYHIKRGRDVATLARKHDGTLKRERDKRQMTFRL